MNKKILVSITMLTVLAMLLTPLAIAKPWDFPKNNDKFEEFGVTFNFDFASSIIPATYTALDETKNPNKVDISFNEIPQYYEIRVGDDKTYYYTPMPVWSISGDWEFLVNGVYTHKYTITQTGNAFTGSGVHPASGPVTYYELVSGTINQISGAVIMEAVYYSDSGHTIPTGYTFTAELTINPIDFSMDGILSSQSDLPIVSTSGASVDLFPGQNDFTYSGVATLTVFKPILPYAPLSNLPFSLFLAGEFHHFRVDYMYDFGEGDGGLDGTLTMLATITGNTLFLSGEKPMWITSLQGTGDFKNVNIKSTAVTPNHSGIVSGWPDIAP